ncbi:NAD(+)/NADH kinase [Candidatus Woesearchaeota archaeon]|nr:NAD(+)/NADH kinase [Candidatus Woesearchaeota archaeon]
MKIAVVSRTAKESSLVKRFLPKGFVISEKPELVIAFGGDGTLLFAERKFPNTPKLFIYHSSKCKNCSGHNLTKVFKLLKDKKIQISRQMKLEAKLHGRRYTALNDFNIHYVPPTALRFSTKIGNTNHKEIIGDGLVVSTPFGSTAYFNSITRKSFKHGIGVAFNNPTEKIKHKVLNENSKVEVKIIRGPAVLAMDCKKELVPLKKGDIIVIKRAKRPASLLKVKGCDLKITRY